jgi:predicted TPR repeat methyltransferase
MTEPLFLTSGDLIADRRYAFACDLIARGDLTAAADLLAQAVEIAPRFASAWFTLGETRERLDDKSGAAHAFHEALAADPEDKHGATVRLARLGAVSGTMPRGYVRALFDQYAPAFDRALIEGLAYRGPQVLHDAVAQVCARTKREMSFARALDLGCGTGLGGAVFRPHANFLAGIDLSERMIAQAQRKNIYDALHAGEMLAFVESEAGGAPYDLIFAADVFAYCGDLGDIARAMAAILDPRGLIVFTVETHDGDGVILRETLRFAHSADHVRDALGASGLTLLTLEPVSTRNEKSAPVPGLVAVAALASSPLSANAAP